MISCVILGLKSPQSGTTMVLQVVGQWYYILDNDDIDTINATVDSTHVDSFTIKATNGVDVVGQQIDIDIFEDVGLPFDKNTMLGQFQEGLPVDEGVLTMLDYTGVSVDDLNSFDQLITFVEIV